MTGGKLDSAGLAMLSRRSAMSAYDMLAAKLADTQDAYSVLLEYAKAAAIQSPRAQAVVERAERLRRGGT